MEEGREWYGTEYGREYGGVYMAVCMFIVKDRGKADQPQLVIILRMSGLC